MADNQNVCEGKCICDLIKQAQEDDRFVFNQCSFCCCCHDGNGGNGGGTDPEPGPEPGDGDEPGGDEPTNLYVTPNLAVNGNENEYVKRTWLSFSTQTQPLTTGDIEITSTPYTTSVGLTSDEVIGNFVRLQYITGYQLTVDPASYQNMPRKWKLYLSSDGGQTWGLGSEEEYAWISSSQPQTYEVIPGFYNAYKFEVLEVNGGNQISLRSLRLIGLPNEVIPILPLNSQTSYYGLELSGERVYQSQSGLAQITQPYNASKLNVYEDGYIEYAYEAPRKVRSFSFITDNSYNGMYITQGWDILGSNNGEDWETLSSARNQGLVVGKDYYFNLNQVAYYKRYRLVQKSGLLSAYLPYFQMYRSKFEDDMVTSIV